MTTNIEYAIEHLTLADIPRFYEEKIIMSEYPKQDKKVILCISNNIRITGNINIVGRSTFKHLEDSDPDIVMYDTCTEGGKEHKTLLVSKSQVYWIDPIDDTGEKQNMGKWKQVKLKLTNDQEIAGEVDITGFNRVSDYFLAYSNRFYEIYECSIADKKYDLLFISSDHVLWKEPID